MSARTSSEQVTITINGNPLRIAGGASVAAALLSAKVPARRAVSGEPRAPLCGMGICMECRATVDGVQHVRTCQAIVRDGMRVESE